MVNQLAFILHCSPGDRTTNLWSLMRLHGQIEIKTHAYTHSYQISKQGCSRLLVRFWNISNVFPLQAGKQCPPLPHFVISYSRKQRCTTFIYISTLSAVSVCAYLFEHTHRGGSDSHWYISGGILFHNCHVNSHTSLFYLEGLHCRMT